MTRRIWLLAIAVNFFGLVIFVIWAIRRHDLTAMYKAEDEFSSRVWKRHPYVPIESTIVLRDQIVDLIAASPKLDSRVHIAPAAQLIFEFLNAYNADDFNRFWEFRVPAGKCTYTPGAARVLAGVLKSMGESTVSAAAVPRPDDVRETVNKFWLASIKSRQHPENKSIACTNCLKAVALDTIEITVKSPQETTTEAMARELKGRPHLGVSVMPRLIDAMPKPLHASPSNLTNASDVCIGAYFNIELRNGLAHPVYIVAAWDSVSFRYIPLRIGEPISSSRRALFIF